MTTYLWKAEVELTWSGDDDIYDDPYGELNFSGTTFEEVVIKVKKWVKENCTPFEDEPNKKVYLKGWRITRVERGGSLDG